MRKLMLPLVGFAILAGSPSFAQEVSTSRDTQNVAEAADREDKGEWGWLGLLGLAGLFGLKRRDREDHVGRTAGANVR
ncbi:MAG: WGxxGxxG family protein [Steroidobacteraceae bacterium]